MLSPKEIQEKEFSMAVRGYNPQQVDEFLDYLVAEFEKLIEENNRLKSQDETVKTVDTDSEKIKVALQNALLSAQLAAEDIKEKANLEAKKIIEEANNKVTMLEQNILQERDRLDEEVKNLKAAKEEIGYKLRALLNSYIKMLDSLEFGGEEAMEAEPLVSDVEKPDAAIQVSVDESTEAAAGGEVADSPDENLDVITSSKPAGLDHDTDVENLSGPEEKGGNPVYIKKKNRINIAPDDLVNKFFGPESSV
ncbi:MAG: DivIVA domain-containing protein [Actinobacteria bacterium]|nr:DivIVA domain-containing protein [Actinomycetota bacterium]